MKQAILKATNLNKFYEGPGNVSVLRNLNLEVYPGETIAILGPSGVGKTTLLNILGTLEKPSSGSIEIQNVPVSSSNMNYLRNRYIGFVFQFYNLLEEYTALDNVLMPARIARESLLLSGDAFQRAKMLLEKVEMSHRASFLAKLLSGGEKQRIAIARALCNDPSLILADEPSGNLDEENSRKIHMLLIQCVKDFNKALIVVTHNHEFASLCDKRFLLKEGVLHPME